jgi:transposase
MDHFAGLDVSVKETSICIVDDTGRIVRVVKVASEPDALLRVLGNYRFKRIGLEAGPLSQWLFGALAEAGLPAICVETRHMRAVLRAQINKTDRNDARGMAQMMRAGALSPGACEDATQSETANAADPSQTAAVQGHRHR